MNGLVSLFAAVQSIQLFPMLFRGIARQLFARGEPCPDIEQKANDRDESIGYTSCDVELEQQFTDVWWMNILVRAAIGRSYRVGRPG